MDKDIQDQVEKLINDLKTNKMHPDDANREVVTICVHALMNHWNENEPGTREMLVGVIVSVIVSLTGTFRGHNLIDSDQVESAGKAIYKDIFEAVGLVLPQALKKLKNSMED